MLQELFKKYNSAIKKRGIKYEIFKDDNGHIDNKQIISLQYSDNGHINNDNIDNENIDNGNIDNGHIDIVLIIRKEGDKVMIYPKHDHISENQIVNLINRAIFGKTSTGALHTEEVICSKLSEHVQYDYIKQYTQNRITFDNNNKNIKLLFKHLIKLIPESKNYCICCGTLLEYPTGKFRACDGKMCQYKMDEMNVGDTILDIYNARPKVLEFLLKTGFASVRSSRRDTIFEPFPPKFLNTDKFIQRGEITALTDTKLSKDFYSIDTIIGNNSPEGIVNKIKTSASDQELCDILGADLYYLTRFMVTTNKTDLKSVKLFESSNDDNVRQFQIIHSDEVENKFKKHTNNQTCFLFHGSGFENWYSIMRNGIKIMSNTKLMVNAAVHGTGIYLSDSFQFSCNYSRRSSKSEIIVAVFEVKGDKREYEKTRNIYVVNRNEDLLLRYLLVLSSNNYYQYNQLVSNKFSTQMAVEKQKNISRISRRAIKRIAKELRDLKKDNLTQLGIRIEVDESNISKWTAYLSNFSQSWLVADLQQYSIEEIQCEIQFPDNYPLYPPFFRIVTPIFVYQTGRVTSGGSICVDVLTKHAWSPATRMDSLLLLIKTLLIEGNGRIDPTRLGQSYSLQKAKESFSRVAKSHNWLI